MTDELGPEELARLLQSVDEIKGKLEQYKRDMKQLGSGQSHWISTLDGELAWRRAFTHPFLSLTELATLDDAPLTVELENTINSIDEEVCTAFPGRRPPTSIPALTPPTPSQPLSNPPSSPSAPVHPS